MSPASSTPRGSSAIFPTTAVAAAFCPTHRRCSVEEHVSLAHRPSASRATPRFPASSEPRLRPRLSGDRRLRKAASPFSVASSPHSAPCGSCLRRRRGARSGRGPAFGRSNQRGPRPRLARGRFSPPPQALRGAACRSHGVLPGRRRPLAVAVRAPPPPVKAKANLPTKFVAAPSMFSVSAPSPVEDFDDRSTEEPEHPDLKEDLLKESAPFLQEDHINARILSGKRRGKATNKDFQKVCRS